MSTTAEAVGQIDFQETTSDKIIKGVLKQIITATRDKIFNKTTKVDSMVQVVAILHLYRFITSPLKTISSNKVKLLNAHVSVHKVLVITIRENFLVKMNDVKSSTSGWPYSPPLSIWNQICDDSYVLNIVNGAKIPFVNGHPPCQVRKPCQIHMSLEGQSFVDNKIKNLLDTGCVKKLARPFANGWYSNIFLVPKKNGSYQLIVNLKECIMRNSKWIIFIMFCLWYTF